MKKSNKNHFRQSALQFIILMGFVSLFSDITYEGARSITGPFLSLLGANAFIVGLVSGFGEFIGYALRLFSGILSDKTRKYWLLTGIGYAINLLAIPFLALAGRWEIAAALLVIERTGKAIRSPARDAILSNAARQVGTGWGFGLHEALDQIGAVSGPLIVGLVLFLKGSHGYNSAFLSLGIPALIALSILLLARILYPKPDKLEKIKRSTPKNLGNVFWLYLTAVSLVAAGYADFPLIAFHLKKITIAPDSIIPIFYALAMGVDAIAALFFGKYFDKYGIPVLALAIGCSTLFAPFIFLGGFYFVLLGIIFWGIGMGAQESIMRATITELIPREKRGSAYGIFNTIFGLFWFLGSAFLGLLYEINIFYLVIFSLIIQFTAIPLLLKIKIKTS